MTAYSSKRNTSLKVIGIIILSALLLGAAGYGAYAILSTVAPHTQPGESNTTTTASSDADIIRQKADELMKKNDFDAAKTEYQKAASTYLEEKNEVAASDTQQQIEIINQTMEKTGSEPQVTPTAKGSGSTPPSTD